MKDFELGPTAHWICAACHAFHGEARGQGEITLKGKVPRAHCRVCGAERRESYVVMRLVKQIDYDKRAVETVACGYCKAEKGEACRGTTGWPVKSTHATRKSSATKAARGEK